MKDKIKCNTAYIFHAIPGSGPTVFYSVLMILSSEQIFFPKMKNRHSQGKTKRLFLGKQVATLSQQTKQAISNSFNATLVSIRIE